MNSKNTAIVTLKKKMSAVRLSARMFWEYKEEYVLKMKDISIGTFNEVLNEMTSSVQTLV